MLNLESITFNYGETKVLDDVSLQLPKGEHLAIMGESGSGKSTLLKLIYGLLEPKEGRLFWDGKLIKGPNFQLIPGERQMKYVSQEFDLMPFTTVAENIAEHLSVFEQSSHQARVEELMDIVGLSDYADTKTKFLSGGQKQRVALARALAQEPELLLLDEPFSNIDQFLKNKLRLQFFSYLKEKGVTLVTASHDPDDVLPFTDVIMVLKKGRPLALEPTKTLYDKPGSQYIASLFGHVNELPIALLKEYAKTEAKVLIYPHEFQLSKESGIEAYVTHNHFKGSHYLIEAISKEGHHILFAHANALKIHAMVYLNISLALINKRMIR